MKYYLEDELMEKSKIIEKIKETGIVAVIRAENAKEAKDIVEAVKKGGITAIEITMTVPNALDVIKEVTNYYANEDVIIGVGSVLDSETARAAILAGAEYVVTPCLNTEVIELCNRYNIACLPGAMSVTEVVKASQMGADIIKVFPGEVVGPKFIKAVRGPLPHVSLMPTGGVSLENVDEWLKAGAVAVGAGGALTKGAKTGDFALVTETAKKFVAKINDFRGRI